MPHRETGKRDEWPPPAMKEGPREIAGTKERHTAGRGHRRQGAREQGTQAAGQRKGRDELKYNGYVLIKGKRLKNFKLQLGYIMNEVTKTTPPPYPDLGKGLLTPPKIRAIFFDKPFSMQLNLAKSGIWSRKSRD